MLSIPAYNFEKEFYKDVREKKRTGIGIFKRKGKRGYVGKMRTTMDILSGKEKRDYIKSGKVVKWNMYKQLIPMDEFREYTEEQQKVIMEKWREVHTNSEIIHYLGITDNNFYDLLHELKILNSDKSKGETVEQAGKPKIMHNQQFKKLSKADKYYVLQDYSEHYSTKEIAKGLDRKSNAAIYSIKHFLKKYMEENNLPLQREEPFQHEIVDEVAAAVEVDEKNHEKDNNEIITLIDRKQVEEDEKTQEANTGTSQKELELQEELVAIKKKIELQALIIDDLKASKEIPLPKNHDIGMVLPQETVKVEKINGMTFNYNDQKEGFMLFSDIEKFISMLKKNPDMFEVEMKITRIED